MFKKIVFVTVVSAVGLIALSAMLEKKVSGIGKTQVEFDEIMGELEFSGLQINGNFTWSKPVFSRCKLTVKGYVKIDEFESWLNSPDEIRHWQLSRDLAINSLERQIVSPYRSNKKVGNMQHIIQVDVESGEFWIYVGASH